MHKPTHSERGLATLRAINCDVKGWRFPPIKWVKEKMSVPTKVKCPTCHGIGQVGPYEKREPCPTCPRRKNWPMHGTGEVTQHIEREVEVGYLDWPKGTDFRSRWAFTDQCNLCGKPVRYVMPVLNEDHEGKPVGMWVGEDCYRTILGVDYRGISMEVAAGEAAKKKEQARVWREIPKPPRVVKPKPPALEDVPAQATLDAVVHELFPEVQERSSYDKSRSTMEYTFWFRREDGRGMSIKVKVTARHGTAISEYYGDKPMLKAKRWDVVALIHEAAPKIRAAFEWFKEENL